MPDLEGAPPHHTGSGATPAGPQPPLTFHSIPLGLFDTFPGRPVILRTDNAQAPRRLLGPVAPEGIAYLQVTTLAQDLTPLADWGDGLAIDLIMADPATELPLLYRCTGLLKRHPVRVTIPLLPGLARAVKLALSLDLAVRLVGHRPDPAAVSEARQALHGYLYGATVAQPVEPFHSLLFALVQDTPVSLWSILEQDPAETRWLDERGEPVPGQGPASLAAWHAALSAHGAECRACPWFQTCGGYFTWPRTDAPCPGATALFADLQTAATALRTDLAASATVPGAAEQE